MTIDATLEIVRDECARAERTFGDQAHLNAFEWLAVLVEEVGEAANELNEMTLDRTRPDPLDIGDTSQERRNRLRAEMTQVAAVAVRWLDVMP